MGNMSYCRFHNTNLDLSDCNDALDETGFAGLSESERESADEMYSKCETFISLYGKEDDFENEATNVDKIDRAMNLIDSDDREQKDAGRELLENLDLNDEDQEYLDNCLGQ